MTNLHPTIAQVFAPYFAPPPVICRKCETPLIEQPIDMCCELAAINADMALDRDKAHRRNNEDFVRAMKLQIQQMDAGVMT